MSTIYPTLLGFEEYNPLFSPTWYQTRFRSLLSSRAPPLPLLPRPPREIDLRPGQRPLIRALSLQQHPPLGLAAGRVDPPPSESSSRISVAPPPAGPRRGALLHLPPLASPRIPPPSPLLARGGSERGSGGPRIPPPPFARACWARARGIPQPPHPPRLRRRVVPSSPPRPGARRRSGGLRSSRRRRPALRFAWVLAVLRSALAPLSSSVSLCSHCPFDRGRR